MHLLKLPLLNCSLSLTIALALSHMMQLFTVYSKISCSSVNMAGREAGKGECRDLEDCGGCTATYLVNVIYINSTKVLFFAFFFSFLEDAPPIWEVCFNDPPATPHSLEDAPPVTEVGFNDPPSHIQFYSKPCIHHWGGQKKAHILTCYTFSEWADGLTTLIVINQMETIVAVSLCSEWEKYK